LLDVSDRVENAEKDSDLVLAMEARGAAVFGGRPWDQVRDRVHPFMRGTPKSPISGGRPGGDAYPKMDACLVIQF